jgi:hypothetical protein
MKGELQSKLEKGIGEQKAVRQSICTQAPLIPSLHRSIPNLVVGIL